MRKRFLTTAAAMMLGCALSGSAFAAKTSGIESFTLGNGLEVIVITNHRIPAVSQMIWYRVGGADDPLGKSGLAHFHEHTMFLGTKLHKKGEYSAISANHGGDDNAFTDHDATAYFVNVPKSELPLVMELESDRMHELTPTDEAVTKEKQVIIEERRMRIENNPDAMLSEQVDAALFRNHPYKRPVIGWMHEMEGLTKQDVLAFHNTWYHPNNAILIISGDITATEVKPLAEKYYGVLPKVAVPARHWDDEPPQITQRHQVLHHANVKQPQWSRSYAVSSVAYGHKDHALPLYVLSEIIGDGKISRFYQSLVVEQKLASEVSVGYSGFRVGPATFEINVTPEAGVTLETIEKAVDKEVDAVLAGSFTDAELSRAKTLLKAQTIFARDGLTSMARIMGTLRLCGLDASYFTRWPDMIDAVNAQQVSEVAKESLQLNRSVTSYLLPAETKAGDSAPDADSKTLKGRRS